MIFYPSYVLCSKHIIKFQAGQHQPAYKTIVIESREVVLLMISTNADFSLDRPKEGR
jgi:hypothetical protein